MWSRIIYHTTDVYIRNLMALSLNNTLKRSTIAQLTLPTFCNPLKQRKAFYILKTLKFETFLYRQSCCYNSCVKANTEILNSFRTNKWLKIINNITIFVQWNFEVSVDLYQFSFNMKIRKYSYKEYDAKMEFYFMQHL